MLLSLTLVFVSVSIVSNPEVYIGYTDRRVQPKSIVWKIFKKTGDQIVCDLCSRAFAGGLKSQPTTSLLKHFKTKHRSEYLAATAKQA